MRERFYIRTYGCQMNERDSGALACLLEEHGFTRGSSEETADIVLLNTCSVRDQAERKVFGKVGLLKRLKRRKPGLVIVIMGCMAQNHGEAIVERQPHVDLVVGTDQIHQVPGLVGRVLAGEGPLVAVESSADTSSDLTAHVPGRVSAYVSVMRGCDQFCSYCIVPYVRGREKSRSVENILGEVEALAAEGTREVFFLGQNITAYGLAELRREAKLDEHVSPFAELLRAVHKVPGVQRIRFTSPHVKYMNRAFLDTVCELPKVCNAFHIPLQSGSDRLLNLMRRGYTVSDYLRKVSAIRARVGRVSFSTDVIVGFPSETDEDFQATREAMAQVGFDMAYVFRYSPRAGTKAAEELVNDVPKAVKEERNQLLLRDLEMRAERQNQDYLGKVVEVLVAGQSKRNRERWMGRSETNKVCIFEPSPGVVEGTIVDILVERTTSHALYGVVRSPLDGGQVDACPK